VCDARVVFSGLVQKYRAFCLERGGEDALTFSYFVYEGACVTGAGYHYQTLEISVAVWAKHAGSAGASRRDKKTAGPVHILLQLSGDVAQVAVAIGVVICVAPVGGQDLSGLGAQASSLIV
jgi:hypothetical protein